MEYNLTEGSITGKLLKFAFPLMIGNLLQQCYNIADTLIVGRFLGADALAAVGSAYTLMVFLTSIILGLCMGSSAFFSMQYGAGDKDRLKKSFFLSFVLIGAITLALNFLVVWNIFRWRYSFELCPWISGQAWNIEFLIRKNERTKNSFAMNYGNMQICW